MSFKRHISKHLEQWKNNTNRKPLILRGARQVGKTTLVKDFSKSFKNSILLNLEKPKNLQFFDAYDDVSIIKDVLFLESQLSESLTFKEA